VGFVVCKFGFNGCGSGEWKPVGSIPVAITTRREGKSAAGQPHADNLAREERKEREGKRSISIPIPNKKNT
jgi:hypothetical protein